MSVVTRLHTPDNPLIQGYQYHCYTIRIALLWYIRTMPSPTSVGLQASQLVLMKGYLGLLITSSKADS
jgi:hypothetical protein